MFRYPASAYRSELESLPQLVIPRNIFEGTSNLYDTVHTNKILFSDRFFICTPRVALSDDFANGVASIVVSTIGLLWIHLFATAGSHLSSDLSSFPLPSVQTTESIGAMGLVRQGRIYETDHVYYLADHRVSRDTQLAICRAYGLDNSECATILSLGHILGFHEAPPNDMLDEFSKDETSVERLRDRLEELGPETAAEEYARLYLQILSEEERDRYLVLTSDHYEISLDKEIFRNQ